MEDFFSLDYSDEQVLDSLVLPVGSPGPHRITRFCGFGFDLNPPQVLTTIFPFLNLDCYLTSHSEIIFLKSLRLLIHFILDVLLGPLLN